MTKSINLMARNKVTVLMLSLTLIVGGISAQAAGILNSNEGGYLVCVNSKTKVITHPGTAKCPKGNKSLVIGAQGTTGITGATGLSGKDGRDGTDGKTLWNGVKDPENSWGAPGDVFINSATKTLFGPKNIDGTWPVGVSLVGPQGERGLIGLTGPTGPQGPGGTGPAGATGATGAAGPSGSSAPISTSSNCIASKCTYKIGDTGPGGGTIFFVDYHDRFTFDYLEAAPKSCEGRDLIWATDQENWISESGWSATAIGKGKSNTLAMMTAAASYRPDTEGAGFYSSGLVCGGKSDWFLGSLGEMKLLYDNLQGLGGDFQGTYWSSSTEPYNCGRYQDFWSGTQDSEVQYVTTEQETETWDGVEIHVFITRTEHSCMKNSQYSVRPVRSF